MTRGDRGGRLERRRDIVRSRSIRMWELLGRRVGRVRGRRRRNLGLWGVRGGGDWLGRGREGVVWVGGCRRGARKNCAAGVVVRGRRRRRNFVVNVDEMWDVGEDCRDWDWDGNVIGRGNHRDLEVVVTRMLKRMSFFVF